MRWMALLLATVAAAPAAFGYSIIVDGDPADWVGTPSLTRHAGIRSQETWIYTGAAGDQRDAPAFLDQDITEVRVTADGSNLYLLVRVQDITDESLHLMLAVDTDQDPSDTGLAWIGDDSTSSGSSMGLGGGNVQWAERNVELHFTGTEWVAEFYADDGSEWYDLAPPGDQWDVVVSPTHDTMEIRLGFLILGGIDQTSVLNLTLATAVNAAGWCNDLDTTVDLFIPDGIDVMTDTPGSLDDAWNRDFGDDPDYDVDHFFTLDLGTTIVGTPTPAPTAPPTPDPTVPPTPAPTTEPTPDPTPEPSGTPTLMNIWHIPSNTEPSGFTMRNRLVVEEDDLFVYIYLGAEPQGTIWDEGTSLFYREQGQVDWQEADFTFLWNEGINEYWYAAFENGFAAGQTVEYYVRATGNPTDHVTTFLYGDDSTSTATEDEATAQAGAYTFTVQPATPGCDAMVAWHVPQNIDPPGVSMRNPLTVGEDASYVYFYLGAYPMGSLWAEGTDLYFRLQGAPTWTTAELFFDVFDSGNESWRASIENTFAAGQVVEYYLRGAGNPISDDTTYVYGNDAASQTTCVEAEAQASPFVYTVQTASPTCDPINAWHIPDSAQPPSVTMRDPLVVLANTAVVYFYVGASPLYTIYDPGSDLFYKEASEVDWSMSDFNWDANNPPDEHWMASFENRFAEGDTVQYYLRINGDPAVYDTTFVYDDAGSSTTTCTEATAQGSPFTFTIQAAGSCTPYGSVWHIPSNQEPPGVTMRNPLAPQATDLSTYVYLGIAPEALLWEDGTKLFYRRSTDLLWQVADMAVDSVHATNEYWIASIPMSGTFTYGETVEYYLRAGGNPISFDTTYVYDDSGSSTATCDEAVAQGSPFRFTLPEAPAVPSATPLGLALLSLGIGGLVVRRRRG